MREFINIVENELTEVKMIDDFGDEGYQIERVFRRWTAECEDAPVVGNINGYELRNKDVNGRSMFYVVKDGECAGRATVDPAHGLENTVKVSHIVIHPDLRRKGLGIGIYEHLLQSSRIVTDYDQTRFGRAIWSALAHRHVVRRLEIDDSIGEQITDTDPIYGTRTRMIASRA